VGPARKGDDVEVDSRSEIGPGQVEWLDLGPADAADPTGDPKRRSRRPWYLLAALIAVVVIVVAALNHDTKPKTATASHLPTAIASETVVRSSTEESPTPSPTSSPSIAVTNLGHQLLDVPADWELFGRATDAIVRIELARGRVTRTTVPAVSSGGGVSMLVGPDRVIVRPYDKMPGYEVRDGRPATDLPAVFGEQGPLLPGPDRNHLWAQTGTGNQTVMRLVGYDGRPTGVSIRIPEAGQAGSDEAGYLTFYGTGGVYLARPGVVRRITAGELIAAGPTRWLTRECDDQYRCQTVVTDRNNGARRVVASQPDGYGDVGVIAPDGSNAALIRMTDSGAPVLHIIDLATGVDRRSAVSIDLDNTYGGGQVAWSPDSRWLFVVGANGRIVAQEARTMRILDLGVTTPPMSQVVLRSGSS
jgi:hypothetical protein